MQTFKKIRLEIVIEQAVNLIITGSIIHYKYNPETQSITGRANSNSPI